MSRATTEAILAAFRTNRIPPTLAIIFSLHGFTQITNYQFRTLRFQLTGIGVLDRVYTGVIHPRDTLCVSSSRSHFLRYTPSISIHVAWSHNIVGFLSTGCMVLIQGTLVGLAKKNSVRQDTVVVGGLKESCNATINSSRSVIITISTISISITIGIGTGNLLVFQYLNTTILWFCLG